MGFGQAQVPGEELRTGGKSGGKNMLGNSLQSLPENLLNTWPVLTVFIGLFLGTKKIKDRRTPTAWVTATGAQEITEPLGHTEEKLLPKSQNCTYCCSPVHGGLMKQETRDCKEMKILLGIGPSNHRSEDLLP